MGGRSPLQARNSATLRQKHSLGGCSLFPNVPPNGLMLSSILESKFESSGVDILRHKSLRVSSGEINVGHTGFHPCGVLALVFISTPTSQFAEPNALV